jgi:hypothetical protein
MDWREASTPLVQWLHHRGGVARLPLAREMIPTQQKTLVNTGVSFELFRNEENVCIFWGFLCVFDFDHIRERFIRPSDPSLVQKYHFHIKFAQKNSLIVSLHH